MPTYQETEIVRGKPVSRHALEVEGQRYVIRGGGLRTATLLREWHEDVKNPPQVVEALSGENHRADIFSFWQRIPDTQVKYPDYYHEPVDIAAIPIQSYEEWWEKQIPSKTRNMVRKTRKKGVAVGEDKLDDRLVSGIVEVFNESPIRRGKKFWHYGKNFRKVHAEMSRDAQEAIFISAYVKDELIGFVKLLQLDRYAMITLILDKISHRDKSPMNGMIAKAVEICANRNIPYLTYTIWRKGDHGAFQKRNAFEKITVPRYFVPTSFRGRAAIRLGLHQGIRGKLSENTYQRLLGIRAKWVNIRHSKP
jgi:hypothetical protein